MKQLFHVAFLCLSVWVHGQIQINGTLLDKASGQPLAFANIGIKNKNIGTVSSHSGSFSIIIPNENKEDSLSFFLTGYQLKTVSVQELLNQKNGVIQLKAKPVRLIEVEVSAKKLKEEKHGISKLSPLIHLIDASVNQKDIFEITESVKLDARPSKVISVNLLINETREDSGTFRVNFYRSENSRPGERLTDINITERKAIREGWLTFDLKKYSIFLKGEVFMAIEFLPAGKMSVPIKYEVKLGGRSRSFVRNASMGLWNASPHHYRMFLTTLESEDRKDMKEEREVDLKPQTRFFSETVKDTFSLFIHLPESYYKSGNRKYPAIFLLDANVYFEAISASAKNFSLKNKSGEVIIIGIGYKNFIEEDSLRDRDFTYPVAMVKDSFPVSGGAEKFLACIEGELSTYLSDNYRIDLSERTLMGHSLGGYFTLFALQRQLKRGIGFFKNYVSASPSLEFYDSFLLSEFSSLSRQNLNTNGINVLLTTGALEEEDAKTFTEFERILSKEVFKNKGVEKIVWPGADHMSTALPTFERGLEMIRK